MEINLNESTAFEISCKFTFSTEKLYNAFLSEDILKKIWGVTSISIDAKPEGKARAIFRIGEENWDFTITYKELIPNEKIRWIVHFDRFPEKETRVTLLFNSRAEGADFKIRMENLSGETERNEHCGAWKNALNSLHEILK
jgi:uncharacterized protein YndB with AHSA1/START domain